MDSSRSNPEIKVSQNANGPVYIMRQHKSNETHNGFTKGDRVRIKDTEDLDSVYNFARGQEGTVICTFPSIIPGKISLLVSLDRDKGKWSEIDEGENFAEDAVEKITE